jgi:hypothetical protein
LTCFRAPFFCLFIITENTNKKCRKLPSIYSYHLWVDSLNNLAATIKDLCEFYQLSSLEGLPRLSHTKIISQPKAKKSKPSDHGRQNQQQAQGAKRFSLDGINAGGDKVVYPLLIFGV